MSIKVNSNITLRKARIARPKGVRDNLIIKKSDEIFSHNVVVDIGKSFLIRSMAGDMGSQPTTIRYVGIGRSLSNNGVPAPSDASLVTLTDPSPFYLSITNYELLKTGSRSLPTSVKFFVHIIGTNELFDHFESGSSSVSIGELGLFFNATDQGDPSWGEGPGGTKGPYTMFARDQILESVGSPLILERSSTPTVFQAWLCTWSVDLL